MAPSAPRGGALAWHLHEMPFGFACAVIGGFLLTAVAWCVGFGVFVVCYAPMLWRPRVDGRAG